VLLLLSLVLQAGCGVKLMYNTLDRFARWGISDYVDLTDAQRDYFDAEVAKLLYWHRTQHLPQYADLIEALALSVGDGTDMSDIQRISEWMFLWYEEIEVRLVPIAVEVMLSLDDEQVSELPRRLERDNERLEEDEAGLSPLELQRRWQREYRDGFERLVGKLNSSQQAYLATQSLEYIPQYSLWADYRRRWQADVLQLIRSERDDPRAFEASFRSLVAARIPVYYGAELTEVFKRNERQYQEVTVWLLNNLTDKQSEKLQSRLLELASAFRELTDEADDQAPATSVCLVRC
jgi:hypothetical protein